MSNVTMQAHREKVGRRIRNARLRKGLSHDRLAALCGTSRQHLIKLEKGKHLAGESMLRRIAEHTESSYEWLTAEGGDDEEEPDPVADLMAALRAFTRHEARDEARAAVRELAVVNR